MIRYNCDLCERDENMLSDDESLQGVKVGNIKPLNSNVKEFTVFLVSKHETKVHLCSSCLSDVLRWG